MENKLTSHHITHIYATRHGIEYHAPSDLLVAVVSKRDTYAYIQKKSTVNKTR